MAHLIHGVRDGVHSLPKHGTAGKLDSGMHQLVHRGCMACYMVQSTAQQVTRRRLQSSRQLLSCMLQASMQAQVCTHAAGQQSCSKVKVRADCTI